MSSMDPSTVFFPFCYMGGKARERLEKALMNLVRSFTFAGKQLLFNTLILMSCRHCRHTQVYGTANLKKGFVLKFLCSFSFGLGAYQAWVAKGDHPTSQQILGCNRGSLRNILSLCPTLAAVLPGMQHPHELQTPISPARSNRSKYKTAAFE